MGEPIRGQWVVADMTESVAWVATDEDGNHEELERMTKPDGDAWLVLLVPADRMPDLLSGEPVTMSLSFGSEQ